MAIELVRRLGREYDRRLQGRLAGVKVGSMISSPVFPSVSTFVASFDLLASRHRAGQVEFHLWPWSTDRDAESGWVGHQVEHCHFG
jgi:hypothetical protein